MVQLVYKYDKCSECGQEKFQWGIVIEFTTMRLNDQNKYERVTDHTFICHLCVKEIDIKLNDLEEDAKKKAWIPDKSQIMTFDEILKRREREKRNAKQI